MPQTKRPPARERARLREAALLSAARKLGLSEGYLAFRMADLAEEAGVSIGSLYRQFEAKEDVITALAAEAWVGRLAGFEQAFARTDLAPDERLVAGMIGDVRFSLDHPELFGAEELAATRAVREGTSDARRLRLTQLHDQIVARITQAARAAIDAGAFRAIGDAQAQARTIDLAIWTLMAGTSHIVGADPASIDGERALPRGFLDVLVATFIGLGWQHDEPRDCVERIAHQLVGESMT